jgi:hypothetical protein
MSLHAAAAAAAAAAAVYLNALGKSSIEEISLLM